MQDKLKHRLIGLAVIVVSSAILLPLFFKGEGYKARHGDSIVPPMPEMPAPVDIYPTSQRLPDTNEIAPLVSQVQDKPKEETVVIVPVEQAAAIKENHKPAINLDLGTPALDVDKVAVAWTLQLATFSNETNARELRDKLVADGNKVYLRKEGHLVKVFVGPDLQKGKLEQLKAQLDKDYKLQSIIIRFSPN
ncbi:MAG: SPOR domain-containing protein [Pontibacterium sp.]